MSAAAAEAREPFVAPLEDRLLRRGLDNHFTVSALSRADLADGLLPPAEYDGHMAGLAELRARHRLAWDRALSASRSAADARGTLDDVERRERNE